ncbi:MAG TPA: HEAT repeat domain-containing protein, partial [Vicinamibacteria bacterium]
MVTRLLAVRPEERRGTVAAFLTIFGTLAAHTLLETARDALFLARLPASRLAVVYLLIAFVAVGVAQVPWGRRRPTGAFALSRLLLLGAVVTFLFWVLGRGQSPTELYALYVWTGLLGSMAVLQFWMVLGDLYTLTQAKRLYSFVWTGSLLGATVGAALARLLAERAGAPALVLAAAALLAVTALGPALILGRAEGRAAVRPRGRASLAEGLEILKRDAYVRSLAVLVLVSTVALTLGDYVFKSAVARSVPKEELGAFFGGFYALLNLLALAAQVAVGGWLFRAIGLHRALWILPALVFAGAAGVALGGGLVAALLLKGADGSLRNSLHRTGTELLYLPLKDVVRARAKPLIDVVGQRGGQALASLLILSESVLARGDVVLAGASAAVSLVWIAWVADLKGLYLDVFRAALREGTLRPAVDLPPVDLVSLETLFGALNSADDHEVLAAMDLLADEGRARLIPALILYHPSPRVVLRALDLFAADGRADFLPVAERLGRHAEAEVRAAALRARTRVRPEEEVLRAAFSDPSPLVRATAVAGLVAGGWQGEEARASLERLLADGDAETSLALARAIAAQPSPAFEEVLLRLADRAPEAALVQVARAMGAVHSPRFLPALLGLLGRREVRAESRAALAAYGKDGLDFLDSALADTALPVELRRQVPRTITLFEPARAAAVLERHVLDEPSGAVRYGILRGMNRLAASPEVEYDAARIERAAAATAEG